MGKSVITFMIVTILFITGTASGNKNELTGYTGSSTCQTCHEEVYKTWKSSKHAANFEADTKGSQTCNICHSTGLNPLNQLPVEERVGCEACHGPGSDHINSEGDTTKIVLSSSPDICGSCHNGSKSGDDMTGMLDFRPGMKLSDIKGLKLISVSQDKLPPFFKDLHPSLTYNMWLASGHAKTPDQDIKINGNNHEGNN